MTGLPIVVRQRGRLLRTLVIFVAVGLPAACKDDHPHMDSSSAPTIRPARPPRDEVQEVVAFLQLVGNEFAESETLCWQAVMCGDIDPTLAHGSVASPSEMRPCFDARVPLCESKYARLESRIPPAELRPFWRDMLYLRAGANAAQARNSLTLLKALGVPPAGRVKGRSWRSIEDWALATDSPARTKYLEIETVRGTKLAAWEAVRDWLEVHKVCNPGVACWPDKVMNGAPMMVQAKYWRKAP